MDRGGRRRARCVQSQLGRRNSELREFQRMATTIRDNAKGQALLTALGKAFAELERLGARYAPCLGHDRARLGQLAMQARTKLAAMVQALDLTVSRDSLAARLIDMPEPSAEQKDGLGGYALEPVEGSGGDAPQAVETPMALLAKGVQDVTQAMVEGLALNDVLRMVLETMYRALGMQRVVLCLKDTAGEQLSGRLGLGHDASRVARLFRVPLQSSELLFSAVCLKGLDTHIRDASAANVASRLPDWYRRDVHAPAFLLLPMHFKGSPFGLIYADRATVDAARLQEQELALLRTLRNQAVMAFRQAASGWLRASLATRPSRRTTTRSAWAAMSGSWVTISTVMPCSRLRRCSSCMISRLRSVSRLPVGSSASSTVGRVTMARAIATRCCWPPESSAGVWSAQSVRPTSASAARAAAWRAAALSPR